MKLSVIILNYNVRYFLEQCILSVERACNGIESEIIVADNNSQDGSCEMIKERFPHIQLVENKENVGFSKANNQAVKLAKGEYLCILNPDTAVAEDVFIKMLQFVENKENLGAVGVHLLDGTGSFLPESKRNLPTPKRSLLKLLGFVGKSNYYANDLSEHNRGDIPVLVGAFMFLKRSVYNEVGGFDEAYFMYGEDIDLSYKITKAGYQNKYLGDVKVLHYKGESTQKDKVYYQRFYGAMRIFYRTHFARNIGANLLVRMGISLVKVFKRKSGGTEDVKTIKPQKAYVFTENFGLLKQLTETVETPLKNASKSILADTNFYDTLFIFDVDYMSYSQIFSVMSQQANKGNIFRIRPKGSSFLVGSDRSDQKGTVLVF